MATVEIEHLPILEAKAKAKQITKISVPSFKPTLEGRWRAEETGEYKPDADMEWFLKQVLSIIPTLSDITTQRALYYMLRGQFPDKKFRGNPLGSDKFYNQLVSQGMEKVQLATNTTMQSLGIWAAPRGYIAGDGRIRTQRRSGIPLTAQPTLQFDLVDVGTTLESQAKKIIHFEKDAGFASLVSGDMPKWIEAMFSTSQGQLSETANKFLRQAENWGLKAYSVHDADSYGLQMSLLYGLASKNNCYMPSEFYPENVVSLGFFPSIAKSLKLPAEAVTEEEEKIFANLRDMAQAKPELSQDVETLIKTRKKWEFQALNAISEKAPQIYLIEGLRASGDEIKHVPDAEELKQSIIQQAKGQVESTIDYAIEDATTQALEQIKEEVRTIIRETLAPKIEEFRNRTNKAIVELEGVPATTIREAVKTDLVNEPAQYWPQALGHVFKNILTMEIKAEAKVESEIQVSEMKADMAVETNFPKKADILTKDDIVGSIEAKIIRRQADREKLVNLLRKAWENRTGTPDLTW